MPAFDLLEWLISGLCKLILTIWDKLVNGANGIFVHRCTFYRLLLALNGFCFLNDLQYLFVCSSVLDFL